MEHIELIHPSLIANLPERTAQALDWLSRVSAPPEDVVGSSKDAMGPVGGGLIRHRFFKDDEAPLDFSSIDALERYMNEVCRLYFFRVSAIRQHLICPGPQDWLTQRNRLQSSTIR
jgi:hypothetical protein